MAEGDRTVLVRVEGTVQGVGFRAFTQHEAAHRAVHGWVVNRDDGSVEAALHGGGAALADLIGLLRKGPPGAAVAKLDVRSADLGRASDAPDEAVRF